jgi:hypothetical protein
MISGLFQIFFVRYLKSGRERLPGLGILIRIWREYSLQATH